jgi:4'-phosphopantetheinyl transferase
MVAAWSPGSAVWSLSDHEVHIWRLPLDRSAEVVAGLQAHLTAGEQERATRFYWERDRARFTVGRGLMRAILGRYLGVATDELRIAINEHGKPYLVGDHAGDLFFNLSHSAGLALLAVTRVGETGVDVERIRENVDHERLAARFFSPVEVAELQGLPNDVRVEAFFHCWARKEAYIKGQGVGIGLGLQSFDVTVAPDKPARLLATRPDAAEAGCWQLQALQPADGYAGAVAVRGREWRLRCWSWTDARAAMP